MFRHLQELFPILHRIYLDLYTILHHSLLPLSIQTKQVNLKTILTSKLPVDIMTYSITPFIHTLIQISNCISQSVVPPPQYIPIQQDTFINTSASIPEPMKRFDGLDHSYTPAEYLQQVEARLTFAIGEEPQNNSVKYRSWHNRRMAYIQCSLLGTALDWYTILHI